MAGSATTLERKSKQGAKVGRQRKPQSKEVSRTPAGRFGAHLNELMDAKGITAAALAKKIGKTEEAVNSYLRGRAAPPFNDWPKLAKSLGLKSLAELLPDISV